MSGRIIIHRDDTLEYDDGHNWQTFLETADGRVTGHRYLSEETARIGAQGQWPGVNTIDVE
jgi:hypothetical protein